MKKESSPVRSPRAAHSSCRDRAASSTAKLRQNRMFAHRNIKIRTQNALFFLLLKNINITLNFMVCFHFIKTRNRLNFNFKYFLNYLRSLFKSCATAWVDFNKANAKTDWQRF